jgi:LmbE family N-acetylglucosaminyl deacetylase
MAFHRLASAEHSALVVDIGDTLEKKLAAIACYETQFPPARSDFLERLRATAIQQGMAAGFAAGEVLFSPIPWGTRDLMGLIFGP